MRRQHEYQLTNEKTALPDVLVLLQSLIEGKDDLAIGETIEGKALLLYSLNCSDLLLLLLRQLCKIEIKYGEASTNEISLDSFVSFYRRNDYYLEAISLLVRPLTMSMAQMGLFLSQLPVIALKR